MLFTSAQFIFVFLPIVLSVFFLLGRLREQMLAVMWLVIASLVFYSLDDPYRLLPLILASIAFNFFIGRMLLRSQNRVLLAIGVGGDLLLLGYFKYAGFLAETLNAMTGVALQNPNVALPIGISFFTFTQIAFLVDAYRGEAREYEPFHYTLFVSFFSHIITGPIYHHKEIMPQFHLQENVVRGCRGAICHADFQRGGRGSGGRPCQWLDRGLRLRAPTLLRFFRLYRHGDWLGADDRRASPAQFRLAL